VIDRENPILCYVTDRRSPFAPSGVAVETALVEKIAAIAGVGVDWLQIREKDLPGGDLAALTREAIARTRAVGANRAARVIVNDRVDVAIAEGASGVHLGESGLPVAEVTRWAHSQFPVRAGGDFLIGASCHSLEGAKAAVQDGADYIFFGPVFATPSKAKFGEPQSVKKLAAVCSAVVSVPVIAIGGITLENAGECIAVGAAGIAAIRLFQDAADPVGIVSALKKLRQ
jgi:thiamine-phosphate pyrophosphorylase